MPLESLILELWGDTVEEPVYMQETCPECGGWGGEKGSVFSDLGWNPCYRCFGMGVVILPPATQEGEAHVE